MKAAVMRDGQMIVDNIDAPVPGNGEVLVKTLACGICGSDLHTLHHGEKMVQMSEETGGAFNMDLKRDIVMGHEFCAEILDHGPGTNKTLAEGTRVCSVPMTFGAKGMQTIGYSNDAPGGYGEQMVLNEMLLLPVPNGLATEKAVLTEPMAVGYHAVQKANLVKGEVPLVIGCGPVGLAVIVALKMKGIGPVIAADYSPKRRALAEQMGADIVIDPAQNSPYDSWQAVAGSDVNGNPLAPNPFTGAAEYRQGVYFECVGVPGILQQMMLGSAKQGRIVVVGVCMESDTIQPLAGINRELNLQFVLGYSPEEFAETLHNIAEGIIDVTGLVTGQVEIDAVPTAFSDLADPEQHAKILVVPA